MPLYLIEFKNQTEPTYYSGESFQRDRHCWYFTDNIDHAIRVGDKDMAEKLKACMPMRDSLVVVEHKFGDGN
jgi:hypothetical protein